jgi:FkbM family methyltransferase
MFLISHVLDGLAALAGPRSRHALHINRMQRWGKGEAEWRILDQLVDASRAAVDVGASSGVYSARLSQLCPRVHAFEPIPWMAVALRQKVHSNVVVHNVALSDRRGEAVLRIPIEDNCLTTIDDSNKLPRGLFVQEVATEITRMDDVVSEPVGFIKIDVEGHELAVLRGALETIRKNRPTLLVESQKQHNPSCPEAVWDLLTGEDYSAFYLKDGIRHAVTDGPVPEVTVNYIFEPN